MTRKRQHSGNNTCTMSRLNELRNGKNKREHLEICEALKGNMISAPSSGRAVYCIPLLNITVDAGFQCYLSGFGFLLISV